MTRRKDGRYQAVVTINGKRLYFLGKTRAEVQKKMLAHRERAEHGAPFAEVAAAWWEETSARISPNSLKNYGAAYKRAKTAFTLRPCGDIAPREIAAEIDAFAATHSEKTVKTQLGVYNAIFRYAVKEGACESNPARDVAVPVCGVKKTTRHGVSSEDISRVKASAGLPFGKFAVTALYTGMRLGELIGLRWEDYDLDARRISIARSVYWANGKAFVKAPKTEMSAAPVPITDALLSQLPSPLPKTGVVFANEEGGYMTAAQFKKAWKAYCAASGVTATPHQFRHSFATMLFEADVPPEHAQALLRHAQISTTMDVYRDLRDRKLTEIHQEVYAVDIS